MRKIFVLRKTFYNNPENNPDITHYEDIYRSRRKAIRALNREYLGFVLTHAYCYISTNHPDIVMITGENKLTGNKERIEMDVIDFSRNLKKEIVYEGVVKT